MFCIGRIHDYGGKNRDKKYGHIEQISPNRYENVFFHFNGIFDGSDLKKNPKQLYYSSVYVAYYLKDSINKPGYDEAVWVIALDEINPKVLYESINAYGLGGSELASLMIKYCPDQYLGDQPLDYFRFIDDETIKAKLLEKAENHSFKSSICEAAVTALKNEWLYPSNITGLPIYKYESEDKVAKLCVSIRTNSFGYTDLSPILKQMPETFLLREDILGLIRIQELESLMSSGKITSSQVLHDFVAGLSNDVRNQAISYLPIDEVVQSPDMLAVYDDVKLAEWIRSTGEAVYQDGSKWIKQIEADIKCESAQAIAEIVVKSGDNFNPEIWERLSDSCKVRLIIYLSNLEIGEETIRQVENLIANGEDNALIRGALKLLLIRCYSKSPTARKKTEELQELFETGHSLIMDYIVDDFFRPHLLEGIDVPHDLNTYLEGCASDQPEKGVFCDGKVWARGEGDIVVYCPRGKNSRHVGHDCDYREIDLTKTRFSKTKKFKDQHMADFINNLCFEPDVRFMCAPSRNGRWVQIFPWVEYPYKISAYVNMLIGFAPHMKCKCGAILQWDTAYTKKINARVPASVFFCPVGKELPEEERNEHDMNVYLNHCNYCAEQIDSRECNLQEPHPERDRGFYHCMRCGHAETLTKCPVCGETVNIEYPSSKNRPVICNQCNHSGSVWKNLQIRNGIPLRFEDYCNLGNINREVLARPVNEIPEEDELPF